MELTAKTLQEVTFGSSKVRGYNPAEVDQFIEAVAEGVEELRERLRRAVERATRAEQAAAAAGANAESAAAAAPAQPGNQEISKVWERAVAAAEQAVTEAKAEAERLLTEAKAEAEQRTTSANQEAGDRLANARNESEAMVGTAQSEAARISAESQAQLREDIAKLESARDILKGDVDQLAGFLAAEKERVKGHMHDALGSLENYGSDPNAAPSLSTPEMPATPAPVAAPSSNSASSFFEPAPAFTPEPEPAPEPEPVAHDESPAEAVATDSGSTNDGSLTDWTAPAPAPLDAPQFSSEAVPAEAEEQSWGQSEWTAPDETPAEPEATSENGNDSNGWGAPDPSWGTAIPGEPEPPEISWGEPVPAAEAAAPESEAAPAEAEAAEPEPPEAAPVDEGDPFLAELRKAVQDDGPLGPRDEAQGDESSIDSLYANEDDDRSGFFRRNKK